jgi:hypothetical protein
MIQSAPASRPGRTGHDGHDDVSLWLPAGGCCRSRAGAGRTGPACRGRPGASADKVGDVLGGLPVQLGQDAGVGVGGAGDGRQPEGFLDDSHVVPGGEQEGGRAVAQVAQADGRKPGELGQLLEHVGEFGGVQRGPSGRVNSNPASVQASPAACLAWSWRWRWAAIPAMVSVSRAICRSPAPDLGGPWTGSRPSWVICQRMVVTPAVRSVSGRRSPQPSPRRRPPVAYRRHRARSWWRRA